jgi:cytochrome d ubiquinol oxidase subunit II
MDLNTIWFILLTVLITGYAILDGFDFGVGILHLFTKDEDEKRVNINAIAPIWDGNEVWLLTAGGALFAAFPIVYATVFSGFYLAIMLLLVALIFRAVSMEFRAKVDSPLWRKVWDYGFGLGSLLPAILFGVAIGNILRGIPINSEGMFTGSFLGLLNPYSVMVGILSTVLFTMHGGIFLLLKSESKQKERIKNLIPKLWISFVVLYIATTMYTIFEAKFLFEGISGSPVFFILLLLLLTSIVYIPVGVKTEKYRTTFAASSFVVLSMTGLMALSLFPMLVPSITDLHYSLTIYNASSTERTLETMLIIALIGMPLVIGYTIFIYRVFKGKVVLNKDSY